MENGTSIGQRARWTSFNEEMQQQQQQEMQQQQHEVGDPLQAAAGGTTTKAKRQTALLEPVELNELHTMDSQNAIPSLDSPPKRAPNLKNSKNGGEEEQQQKKRRRDKEEVVLTVVGNSSSIPESSNGQQQQQGDQDVQQQRQGEEHQQQQQTKNGQLLATVHPKSTPFSWAKRPVYELAMPPVLTNKQNQLTADVYANIVRTIETDVRFATYALCYSRMIPVWLVFSVFVLLAVLASSPQGGLSVMFFALFWLFMLIMGLLFCALLQKYIVLALRNLMKEVNNISHTYRLLIGVQDREILFIFYDFDGCREEIGRQLRIHQANTFPATLANSMPSDVELAHKAEELMLDHAQAYAKALVKLRLRFPTRPSEGVSDFLPRHVPKSHCLCQFVATEHFNKGPAKRAAPWYERLFAR